MSLRTKCVCTEKSPKLHVNVMRNLNTSHVRFDTFFIFEFFFPRDSFPSYKSITFMMNLFPQAIYFFFTMDFFSVIFFHNLFISTCDILSQLIYFHMSFFINNLTPRFIYFHVIFHN